MKLDFNLQVSQKQGIALTAQVQQAIKLLHMTNLEITEFVEEQFQDNPFIEESSFSEKTLTQSSEQKKSNDVDRTLDANPYEQTRAESKVSQENQFETGESYIPRSTVAKAATDFDALSLVEEKSKSLFAHCLSFAEGLNLTPKEMLVATALIEDLQPTGWLESDINSLSEKLDIDLETVQKVLQELHEIEPAGLFARNLKECLTLQAVEKQVYCKNMAVVLDNLHLIGSGKFDLLKRRSGCSDADIADIFRKIKSFNPKPGTEFDFIDAPIREPDLHVREDSGEWIVELNNSTLPDVRISKDYARELNKLTKDKTEREFIREKITEAKWLANAISKRNETMLKVGSEIIKRQIEFLEKGAEYIQPMILNDIAEAVGMHESTISRVTTGSLIQTPRGTLELKAFFSVGVKQDDASEAKSAASIKYRIKKLIEQEDPNAPISDDAIVETLKSEGVGVARRTVAKYRKMENIPSSFARKRRNIISGTA